MINHKELKRLRKQKGISQIEMARLIEVSANTYRNWEYGANEPNEENLVKLREVLNIKEEI